MCEFQLISTDGTILETFQTAEQRWATGDTVIAHGNRRYRVVSVIPVERMSEFVDGAGCLLKQVRACRCQAGGSDDRPQCQRPCRTILGRHLRARQARVRNPSTSRDRPAQRRELQGYRRSR